MSCRVRPYQSSDREAVRRICADTGFMGDPIEKIFTDREVFADFFTRYYTDYEPECALVAEDTESNQVVGYVLGSVRYRYQSWMQIWLLATRVVPIVVLRFLLGRYNASSRDFLYWVVLRSIRETPPAPPNSGHFHVNLLPAYRQNIFGRRLVFSFFKLARHRGMPRIYGQIQTQDAKRTQFWERYGFRELSRRRITKFSRHYSKPVYVSTLFRDFEET